MDKNDDLADDEPNQNDGEKSDVFQDKEDKVEEK